MSQRIAVKIEVMGRTSKSIFEDLFELPWWVSVAFAAVIYTVLRWLVPAMSSIVTVPGKIVHDVAYGVAPYAALLFLIPAPFSMLRSLLSSRVLARATGSERVRALRWSQFETLVATAFRRIGYDVHERGGAGPDGGVDLVLREEGKTTLVQCKHWKRRQVGVAIVRELYGVMDHELADAGIIVTSGTFTLDAEEFARGKNIELLNGQRLETLLSYARGEASTSDQNSSRAPQTPEAKPICPKCALPMVLRTAKRGANAGSKFWGCSSYPECSGTRQFGSTA
jgi:restriction system protein